MKVEEKFDADSFIKAALQYHRGYEKKKLYAWIRSDGKLLSEVSEDYESLAKKEVKSDDYTVRLLEFVKGETKAKFIPPPDPEDVPMCGTAIGGFIASDVDDIKKEFIRIFNKQYASAKDTEFWVEGNTAFARHNNVCCWVTRSDDLGMDHEKDLKNLWASYVTMVKDWNDEYRDVHLGNFHDGTTAVESAFIGFLKFQLDEQTIDDFF